jgi:hypothetical protein
MSKPVELRLQEAELAKVALEANVAKLAAENDTYTKRMKDMEDAIASAMEKMKAMDDKMENFTKMKEQLDGKMETAAKSLADINIVEQDDEEGEDEEDDSEMEDGEPMAENSIGGVNPKMVTGQPSPTKEKKKGKKAKKATTTSEDESLGKPVNEKFIEEKDSEKKGKTKAEELPATEKVAEEVAPAPVAEQAPVEKVAEVVAPTPVAETVITAPVAETIVVPSIDINALVEAKVAEVAQKFASTLSKFSEMDSELIKSKEAKQVALASVADLQSKYEALLSKVSGIQSEAKTVEEKVAKTVASLGVEPVTNSPSELSVEATQKTAEEILKEWSAMTDAKQKRAFYLKHQPMLMEATFPSKKK